jgi:hypothetical protein
MSRPLRIAALIAAALLLTAAAGCGSGGGATSSIARPSKPAYLKQANAACRKARVGLEEEVSEFLERQRGKKPPRILYADLAHLVLLPTIESEMEAVRAIRVPSEAEGRRVDQLLFAEEMVLNEIAVSTEVEPSRNTVERRFAESGRMLADYGLPACANGLDVSVPSR